VSWHVTLAIPTRNRPDCLRAALQSASAQSDPPDAIVVSDDSDDEFRSENRALAAEHAGAVYVEGPRRGLGANQNHVVAHLPPEAQWVLFMNDDAELFPDFMKELRELLSRYAGRRCIPTGVEIQEGGVVRPNRLGFLGYQSKPHDDYSPGAQVETVVIQTTALPVELLRTVSWQEVTTYGYDEVDMAYKARRLGWRFVFEPSLRVRHEQSPIGRDDYRPPMEIARLYFRLRSFSVYERKPLALLAYLVLAPAHLIGSHIRRGRWLGVRRAPSVVATAYRAWLGSLRTDWRHS
jgi:GT2 family glycosyltransferase